MRYVQRHRLFLSRQVNITVDDTDPSVLYQPATSWFASGNSSGCSFCLTPSSASIAFKNTWHHGLHVVPTADTDDDVDSDGDGSKKGSGKRDGRSMDLRRRDADDVGKGKGKGQDDDDDDGDSPTDTEAYNSTDSGAETSPFFVSNLDSDDPGFVDTPVTLQLNFNGTALYIYCLLPLRLPPSSNSTPTLTNLTFTLDNQPAGAFLHNGSAAGSGFQPNTSVLSVSGLPDAQHTLQISIGPDSVFLFDYYVFTQEDGENSGSTTSSSSRPSAPATIVDAKTKNHNVATFAGAVGGTVGVLGTIAFCVALSIIRRRRRSAKRLRHEHRDTVANDADSFHTDASEDGPPMQGPAPFIPRFFPGTVPVAPPPYIPSRGSPTASPPLETTPLAYDEALTAPFPPPALLPMALLAAQPEQQGDAPPSFGVAIASPEPPLLASVMRRPPNERHTATVDLGTPPMEERTSDVPSAPVSIRPPRPPRLRPAPSPSTTSESSEVESPREDPPGHAEPGMERR
ncbi:hypothetical protein FA95DRAFT_1581004 [Auriscalpium vulgare]|uniref:Uncharacterized protein n=1 Tax=Auriscalpium vulgare TaxID=40419 RepID=A0ACB8S3Y7_9AGAM|nr:hypothetical protein FA95DRAFT_1581004 [Auriscalpium vulgare]